MGDSGPVLLILSRRLEEGPGFAALPLELTCSPDGVKVSIGAASLPLAFDSKKHAFDLRRSVEQRLNTWWSSTEVVGAVTARAQFQLVASWGQVPKRLRAWAALLEARALIIEGRLMDAELRARDAPDDPVHQNEIFARIQQLRASEVGLRVIHQRKLGLMSAPLFVAAEPEATLFWRGTTLCAGQEDPAKGAVSHAFGEQVPYYPAPPQTMRCYDTRTERWGAPQPFLPPSTDDRFARECSDRKSPWFGKGRTVYPCFPPRLASTDWIDALAVLPGPAVVYWRSEAKALYVLDEDGDRAISEEELSARLQDSAGSRMLIGQFALQMHGLADGWAARVEHPERSWPLLPPGGRAITWLRALAAPDQRLIAAVGVADGPPPQKPELWIFQIAQLK